MRRLHVLICLGVLALPLAPLAQAPLLLDPAKVPMTLKGAWIQHETGIRSDIVVRIDSLQPDGSFTGKLDFYNNNRLAACKVINGPIQDGKVTAKMLRIRAQADDPKRCPNFGLTFQPGGEKFLEGTTKMGDKTWLDAPK